MIRLLAISNFVNGTTTFTMHLCRGFQEIGQDVKVVRIGKKTTKPRQYGAWSQFQFMTKEDFLAEEGPVIATSFDYNQNELTTELIEKTNALVTVHHPMETIRHQHVKGDRPVVIRPALKKMVPGSVYIPHPYEPVIEVNRRRSVRRDVNAVSITRVSKDKNPWMSIEANRCLPKRQKIQIYGKEDRMYSYYTLQRKYKEWKCGKVQAFPNGNGAVVCLTARFMVDMSVIPDDGGGTQYTILEGCDGGAVPIVHKDWIREKGEMKENENCLTAANPQDLAQEVLRQRIPRVLKEGMNELLAAHDAKKIARRYLRRLNQ